MLDGAGAVQSNTQYDPWGTPQTALADSFGFTGELQFGEQVHLRARWYNTNLSTFTSRDPFAGFDTQPYSLHPYQYAYSNPVLLTDPSGECPCPDPDADCGAPQVSFGERLLAVLNNANFYPDLYAQATRSRGLNPLYLVFDRFPTAAQNYDPYNDPALAERAEQYYGWDGAMVVDMIAVALGLWRANHLQQHGGGIAGVCDPLILVAIGLSRLGGLDQLMFGPDGRGGGGGAKIPVPSRPVDLISATDPLPTQASVSRSDVEQYARSMHNSQKSFDWNNMRDPITGSPDPIIIERNQDGRLLITDDHHRFLAAKLTNTAIPESAILYRQRSTPHPQVYNWEDVIWTP